MIKTVACRCPHCNADLKIDPKREFMFCECCGAKLLIDDETVHIETTQNMNYNVTENYNRTERKIDEARIQKNASRERLARERMAQKNEKSKGVRKTVIIILFSVIGTFFLVMFLAFLPDISYSIKKNVPGNIAIQNWYLDYMGENYKGVVASLEAMGFENIEVIPLEDLTPDSLEGENTVKSISIAGDYNFISKDIFKKTDKVVITYHSLKTTESSEN